MPSSRNPRSRERERTLGRPELRSCVHLLCRDHCGANSSRRASGASNRRADGKSRAQNEPFHIILIGNASLRFCHAYRSVWLTDCVLWQGVERGPGRSPHSLGRRGGRSASQFELLSAANKLATLLSRAAAIRSRLLRVGLAVSTSIALTRAWRISASAARSC